MTSFYSVEELQALGFKSIGENVLISRNACLYSPETISIGDNVRIDDFCILSGNIALGSHIHISAYAAIYGSAGVFMEDYTGLSPRATIFSAMDDFSGDFLIGPIHDKSTTNTQNGIVVVGKFSQICANAIIFPDTIIGEGCVVGAFSMVKESLRSWGIYAGIPCKRIKERSKHMLYYAK